MSWGHDSKAISKSFTLKLINKLTDSFPGWTRVFQSLFKVRKSIFKNTNQYFSTFGYNFYVNYFLFKNQFFAQIIEGNPISYIFSTKVIFKNYVSLSLHYQPQYLTGGEIGIYLPGNLKISYGMDISNTNGISKYDNNHRFSISFQIFKGKSNWSDRQEFDKPYMIR